ncbi:TPA: hypothetical protein QCR36_003955 [Bacillus cereus]|uniref:hypothetical protein n=1 Tax=Bacillus paranthracis TaxID=2026186 RepID=UPI00111E9A88|nr:hypothetical protein [Bacillus paranthracis]MBJ8109011.1 hypothetical protein [Bacillus cereus group sp. N6]TNP19014.1 hypothetical protein FHY73_15020 [Bacillus tropicus]HDR4736904.1 hypothetical protein [Bacillus cereus]MEC4620768.1 hypothetical protein [Bacillus paranthracis]HDR4742424.1 hypothetical protein [Bacillus cereus]
MVQILKDKLVQGGINVLKFINNQGKKVMEMTDNGDVTILNEELKKSFSENSLQETKKEEKENE